MTEVFSRRRTASVTGHWGEEREIQEEKQMLANTFTNANKYKSYQTSVYVNFSKHKSYAILNFSRNREIYCPKHQMHLPKHQIHCP